MAWAAVLAWALALASVWEHVPEQASSPVEKSGLVALPSRGSMPQGGISPIVSCSSDFLRKFFVLQK